MFFHPDLQCVLTIGLSNQDSIVNQNVPSKL